MSARSTGRLLAAHRRQVEKQLLRHHHVARPTRTCSNWLSAGTRTTCHTRTRPRRPSSPYATVLTGSHPEYHTAHLVPTRLPGRRGRLVTWRNGFYCARDQPPVPRDQCDARGGSARAQPGDTDQRAWTACTRALPRNGRPPQRLVTSASRSGPLELATTDASRRRRPARASSCRRQATRSSATSAFGAGRRLELDRATRRSGRRPRVVWPPPRGTAELRGGPEELLSHLATVSGEKPPGCCARNDLCRAAGGGRGLRGGSITFWRACRTTVTTNNVSRILRNVLDRFRAGGLMLDVPRLRADTPGHPGAALQQRGLGPAAADGAGGGDRPPGAEATIGGYEAAAGPRTASTISIPRSPTSSARIPTRSAFWRTRPGRGHGLLRRPFRAGDRVSPPARVRVELPRVPAAPEAGRIEIDVVDDDASGQPTWPASSARSDRVPGSSRSPRPDQGGLVNPAALGGASRPARRALPARRHASRWASSRSTWAASAATCSRPPGASTCRPPRTGFLYVRRDTIAALEPPFIDLEAAAWIDATPTPCATTRAASRTGSGSCRQIGLGVAARYAQGLAST